jgi:hypothetical protein
MKRITGKSMLDIIAKVYKAEGWTHRLGDVKTKRVLSAYDVKADLARNRWVADRREVAQ